jgi:hypothetical protein
VEAAVVVSPRIEHGTAQCHGEQIVFQRIAAGNHSGQSTQMVARMNFTNTGVSR